MAIFEQSNAPNVMAAGGDHTAGSVGLLRNAGMKYMISGLAAIGLALLPMLAHASPKPRVVLDAAMHGEGKYADKAYFFAGEYYISYDWNKDRVDDGPRPLSRWPMCVAPLECLPVSSVDAALEGVGKYAGKAYFFKGAQYFRYDWGKEAIDPGAQPLTAWKLVGGYATGIDSALNGEGQFAGYAYLFRGATYVKYDWANDKLVGAERSIASGWHLTGNFANRIDAAVSGSGKFAGRAYFFNNDEYVRYIWQNDLPDGAPEKIVDKWPGLVEMAQAARGSTEALVWIGRALEWLREDLSQAQKGNPSTGVSWGATALRTHFHLTTVADRVLWLPIIIKNYQDAQEALRNPTNIYKFRNTAEAAAEGRPGAPAYADSHGSIRFTPVFTKYGPKCQAAMVLHESIHYVDLQPTPDTYEHDPAYGTLTAAQAVHNPSSYPSFAAHILTGKDERFGIKRPDE